MSGERLFKSGEVELAQRSASLPGPPRPAALKKILVVDDEAKIIEVVESFLESRGFTVFGAPDAARAFEIFERETVALILLDLMLPDMSGEEFCAALRKKSHVPIIMLTAKVEEEDMLKGLRTGADDYITKPFSLKTLLARVEAVLRRSGEYLLPPGNRLVLDDGKLEIDFAARAVKRGRQTVSLTPNEFRILEVLVRQPNRVFTRDQLIDAALGDGFDGFPRTIDSHIRNLRQKLEEDPKNPVCILTIHGVGYRFGGRPREEP
ncbi:MAG: response regulator transcription factor [Synergistaceae bacterium]|jgi:DNA-binding response OmpR family regulator|nr:response regulator transcription factor [Synergistaceae bacterium]